jgi:hypothetical protein
LSTAGTKLIKDGRNVNGNDKSYWKVRKDKKRMTLWIGSFKERKDSSAILLPYHE